MALITVQKGGEFSTHIFDGKIYDVDRNELDSGLFTYTSPQTITAYVDARYIVRNVNTTLYKIKKSDTLLITQSDGLEDDFVVKSLGLDKIKIDQPLRDLVDTEISVKTNKYTITLDSTIEEGMYYLSNNEVIIVADTFHNLQIPRGTIQHRYSSYSDNADLELTNTDAKESLIGDFSKQPHFYKVLDVGPLTELLKRKILSILELSENDRDENNIPLTKDYKELLQEVLLDFNTTVDNKPNKDITNPNVASSSSNWAPHV